MLGARVEVFVNQNDAGVKQAEAIILSCKPQAAKGILQDPTVYEHLSNKLVVSICAGLTIAQLKAMVPESCFVMRAMPNTPCMIQHGMTVVCCDSQVPKVYKQFADRVFKSVGRCRFMEEKHMDGVTSLSASGVGFACTIMEGLADGGIMVGLPRDSAVELIAQAMHGAAQLVLQTGKHPAQIRDEVTTPGGCTIAGLLALEDGKIRSTLARAIEETTRVASSLGTKK